MKSSNDVLLCDFCGNSQHVARLLVRGIADAAICDECIATCGEIVAERSEEKLERVPTIVSLAKAWVIKAVRKR
jgi:ATP-dependent protease Clp ATPase subunit